MIFRWQDYMNDPSDFLRGFDIKFFQWLAKYHNDKLNSLFGPKVYGFKRDDGEFIFDQHEDDDDTHTAYLFNLEEIKKECKHDGIIKVLSHSYSDGDKIGTIKFECEKCGKQLIHKWEEIK